MIQMYQHNLSISFFRNLTVILNHCLDNRIWIHLVFKLCDAYHSMLRFILCGSKRTNGREMKRTREQERGREKKDENSLNMKICVCGCGIFHLGNYIRRPNRQVIVLWSEIRSLWQSQPFVEIETMKNYHGFAPFTGLCEIGNKKNLSLSNWSGSKNSTVPEQNDMPFFFHSFICSFVLSF